MEDILIVSTGRKLDKLQTNKGYFTGRAEMKESRAKRACQGKA